MSPIFVDGSVVPPPPPTTGTSADGILTGTVLGDSTGACDFCSSYCDRHGRVEGSNPVSPGVYLEADFSQLGYVNAVVDDLFQNADLNLQRFAASGSTLPTDQVVGTNLTRIPELDTDALSSGGGSQKSVDTSWFRSGGSSLKIVTVGDSGATAAYVGGGGYPPDDRRYWGTVPGRTYTISVYARIDAAVNRGPFISLNQTVDGTTNYGWMESDHHDGTPGSVQRLRLTFSVPADEDPVSVTYGIRLMGSDVTDDAVWFDCLLIEESDQLHDYYDGSTTAAGGYAYRWAGTANQSTSEKYIPASGGSVSDGVATIITTSEKNGPRYWLIGNKTPSTSHDTPTSGWATAKAGQVWSFSIDVNPNIAAKLRIQIGWHLTDGTDTTTDIYVVQGTYPANTWTTLTGTATAPDNAAGVYMAIIADGSQPSFLLQVRNPDAHVPSKHGALIGVRFHRVDLDGTDHTVRGGDFAWAVRGKAFAYDMFASIGEDARWYACPVFTDGTDGSCSDEITLDIPWPEGCLNAWIKPVNDPSLTILAQIIQPFPDFTRAARNTLNAVQGSEYQAGSWDVRLSWTGTWTFYTPDRYQRDRVIAALSAGPVLLQTHPDYLVYDAFVLPGDLTEVYTNTDTMNDPGRTWTCEFTTIAEPPTTDSTSYIPGRTYRDTHNASGTYTARKNNYPTYIDATLPAGVTGA